MAQTLSDVLLRRADWGSAAHPGMDTVLFCADVMSAELGWSPARRQQEINEINGRYPSWRGIHAQQLADTSVQQVSIETA
jgi:glycerol-3-phosphate dehydrogenase